MSKLIPDAQVAQRYGVVLRTLARWDANQNLGFPAPAIINSRKYRAVEELDAWDRARALASQSNAAALSPETTTETA
jgi:hypothetical protein